MSIDIDALYRSYGPMVHRRCRFLLGSEDDALDALQEVFFLLARKRELGVHFPSSLLFRMATNVCISMMRRRQRAPLHLCELLLETLRSEEDHVDLILARDTLDRIFAGEKKTTRTIAVLHWIDRMSHEQVAAEVGMSVSGVRRRLAKLQERVAGIRKAGVSA